MATQQKDYQLKFRIPLPTKPIITKELDEKFLYSYVIEQMEKAKVIADTPDKNLNLTAVKSIRQMKLYLSSIEYFFIPLMLYKRFKYKKNNTTVKSLLKTTAITSVLIFVSEFFFLSAAEGNYDTFISNLLNTEDRNVFTQYAQFKEGYEKLNRPQV